ncbi:MAG TPA: phosphoribosylamine--glycine ligase [Candidatus Saccharimonadales bacterium]|nr:phosphoribosylamine--glycine ligase [Candidatus Saccharimonadales bacterium]
MKTLIVGGGGREHALAMAAHDAGSDPVFTNPNAGMAELGSHLGVSWVPEAGFRDVAIADLADQQEIDLAIIGPEQPLATGLADRLRERKIPTLGFGIEAARLESSKVYANEFMDQYHIPKPATVVADSVESGLMFIKGRKVEDYVIKADGLAGGKGVILPKTKQEARDAVMGMMSGELFGEAGQRMLFQERLHGPEVSMMALFDGKDAEVLFLAQDFKRLEDKDKGPNTGGMGSYAPVQEPIISRKRLVQMYDTLDKTLYGLNDRGITDPGVIYIGFMLADEFDGEPAVMEYNVRFGDPETQAGLTLLSDAGVNVHERLEAAARGSLFEGGDGRHIGVALHAGRAALTVCLAAPGYPKSPRRGSPIYGLKRDYPDVTVHHAATKYRADQGERVLTDGGRVLYVTGVGDSLKAARRAAYNAIGDDGISFEAMQFRTDIGKRVVKALKAEP